jgi:hypothetical protein
VGTRHLIAVQIDGEYKVAQYGQWDGYPSGQGLDVLASLKDVFTPAFKEKLRAARFIGDDEEGRAFIEKVENTPEWPKAYPWISRDAGAKVLQLVLDQPAGIYLQNNISFAGESLFCEYAYVVDYDKGAFEVYRGFNKRPVPEGERFADAVVGEGQFNQGADRYLQVRHWHTWPLNALPSSDEFLAVLVESDEEED